MLRSALNPYSVCVSLWFFILVVAVYLRIELAACQPLIQCLVVASLRAALAACQPCILLFSFAAYLRMTLAVHCFSSLVPEDPEYYDFVFHGVSPLFFHFFAARCRTSVQSLSGRPKFLIRVCPIHSVSCACIIFYSSLEFVFSHPLSCLVNFPTLTADAHHCSLVSCHIMSTNSLCA